MPRPDTTLASIQAQVTGWDQVVDQNTDDIERLAFQEPYPIPIVHRTTADSGSSPLSSFDATDYKWCLVLVVDADTPSTNGVLAYSDGTNWRYQKSNSTV